MKRLNIVYVRAAEAKQQPQGRGEGHTHPHTHEHVCDFGLICSLSVWEVKQNRHSSPTKMPLVLASLHYSASIFFILLQEGKHPQDHDYCCY